jgi:hypothetical protein
MRKRRTILPMRAGPGDQTRKAKKPPRRRIRGGRSFAEGSSTNTRPPLLAAESKTAAIAGGRVRISIIVNEETSSWSMALSENRFPLFGVMLTSLAGLAATYSSKP